MPVIYYYNSVPGTLVDFLVEGASPSDWADTSKRFRLNEGTGVRVGEWSGDIPVGRYAVFEGGTTPDNMADGFAGTYTVAAVAAGTGARTVTVTVTLSGSPVEGANVRVTKGGESYVLTTNASGVVVFNINDGTWTVSITAIGTTFAGASLVVDGNETVSYALTAMSFSPSSPGLTTGYWVVYTEAGVISPNTVIELVTSAPHTGTGALLEDTLRTATSGNDGIVQFTNLFKGATYQVNRAGSTRKSFVTVPTTAGTSVALGNVVG